MERSLRLFLLLLVMIFVAMPVAADEPPAAKETIAKTYNEVSNIDINVYDPLSKDLIDVYYGIIQVPSTGTVSIYGGTESYMICDSIEVRLVLQQWTGSSWTSIRSFIFINNNSNRVIGSRQVQVEGGKHYRLVTYHKAVSGSIVDDDKSDATLSVYVP